MRAGLSTIQQTLTPEAAAVLTQSIAEAARRNHGQTTPLHVAASLLSSPSGFLRQACIRSHPNSSHPLQCRALDLCFSVALDRLPSAATTAAEPPISNALMAALKRAQAHQRRGCPEQQQQPLLAVKVELEQLIVSILDDPSVSRVMREASFSSPAVKAAIEQSIASTSSSSSSSPPISVLGFRPVVATGPGLVPANRNLYVNPRLQQQQRREEEVKRVLDVMVRNKKRNPVLVGDSEPEAVTAEVLRRIEKREIHEGPLRDVRVLSLDKEFASDRSQIPTKLREMANSIEARLGGVVVNLGDLKWLVENPNGQIQQPQQQQQLGSETGRAVVAEVGKLIAQFGDGGCRVWLMGTATCATYLRCQVYHPSMETDWDLQAVPIAPKAPLPGLFPRGVGNGILSSSVESLAPHRGLATAGATATAFLSRGCSSENADPSRRFICPVCMENYEQELGKLVVKEFEKSSSNSKPDARQTLPPWLQAAKSSSDDINSTSDPLQTREQELKWKQNTEGLLRRWNSTCARLHPSFHQPVVASDRPPLGMVPSISNSYNPKILPQEHFQHRLSPIGNFSPLHLSNRCSAGRTPITPVSPPRSPVRTELVLGQPKAFETSALEHNHKDRIKDLSGCTQDFFSYQQSNKASANADTDSFKRLFKGLTDKVGWQPEAASSVAITVAQCRSGNGKRRNLRTRADTWLLFLGPDKVGKSKMASALSELLFGTGATTVSFGGSSSRVFSEDIASNMGSWRMSALDRIAEAVRRNPFSVFVIEDVDQADMIARGRIKQAIERGRLPDSHGREVSLCSAIFIMTADSLPDNFKSSAVDSLIQCEEKLQTVANCAWSLELLVGEKSGKRRGEWLDEEVDRPIKPRTEHGATGLSLDLNLATGLTDDKAGEGSRNSSDLTVEHEHEHVRLAIKPPSLSLPVEMVDVVDDAITFKPVDFSPLRRKISDAMIHKFKSIVGGGQNLSVDIEALEQIVASIWFGGMAATGFEEWLENVLVPCLQQLKSNLAANDRSVMRLVAVKEVCGRTKNQLPNRITIADGHLCGV